MATQPSKAKKIKFLLVWIIANSIGGFLIDFLENNGAQFIATLLLSGAIIGSMQWAVFIWVGLKGLKWLLWPTASAMGWIISTALSSFHIRLDSLTETLASQVGLWEVFWLNLLLQPTWIIGMAIFQGLILGYRTRRRGRVLGVWLAASCLGAAIHGATSAALCRQFCWTLPRPLLGIIEAKGWAVYSIITGLALLWILNQMLTNDQKSSRRIS
ncbi:MAG: hypothetical protein AAFX51_10765 [Cyanobacteria bacterium J06636_28]